MDIAFLGVGLMGRPMAERLMDAGHRLFLFNRTREKILPLEKKGAVIADSSLESIAQAECIMLMLTDYHVTYELLFGDGNIDFKNKTVIQMGTLLPSENIALKDRVVENNGSFIESPVLGSRDKAAVGELIIMSGAAPETFEAFEPLLKELGSVKYIGEVGKASALKLALNQLIISLISSFSLSYGIVKRAGVAVDDFMEILRKSALYAPTFDKKLPRFESQDFSDPNFPIKHMLKDVGLIVEQAKAQELDTAILDAVKVMLVKAIDQGLADQDYSAVQQAICSNNKKEI